MWEGGIPERGKWAWPSTSRFHAKPPLASSLHREHLSFSTLSRVGWGLCGDCLPVQLLPLLILLPSHPFRGRWSRKLPSRPPADPLHSDPASWGTTPAVLGLEVAEERRCWHGILELDLLLPARPMRTCHRWHLAHRQPLACGSWAIIRVLTGGKVREDAGEGNAHAGGIAGTGEACGNHDEQDGGLG